jgi:hypothetical protein
MDILNFISWIKGKRIVTSVDTDKSLIPIGFKDGRRDDDYLAIAMTVKDFGYAIQGAEQTTGLNINYTNQKIYNTAVSPGTGNITENLLDAKLGIVQKIYHNSLIAPSTPSTWVLIGAGFYVPGTLNIIYAEWNSSTRVEYWITQ